MRDIVQEKTTVLGVLKKLSPDSSMTTLKSWVEQGRVCVDGRLVYRPSIGVRRGQEVRVRPKINRAGRGVKILYEDKHLVVVEKPSKLLTVATDDGFAETAHDVLKRRVNHPVFPVHRLDRDTSGVLLFAYTEEAREVLKEKFYHHDIEREYVALLQGVVSPLKGTWQSYLTEDENYFVKSASQGKLAITHYEVLSSNKAVSLVRFLLETGRKNQIRVHAADAGFPIVGDTKYGAFLNFAKRLCLHAHKLGFVHPITEKKFVFTSPLPPFFFV